MRALGISRELWIVVLLVGCSDVQDSDIDGDGIADEEDACQASFADEVVDFDGDGKDATLDLCPHDKIAASGDLDRDGIPDACDPFFDDSKRDTRQCITSFGVRWMNASYLKTRAGELPFDLAPPLRATAADDVSTVSALALDFPSVSFDVVGELTLTATGSFQFWLRAGEQPTNRDVACGIDAANNLYVLAAGVQQAPRPITHPLVGVATPFRLRATVGGTNATVLCRLTIGAETVSTFFEAALSAGSWGFASKHADLRIDSMVIDTNDAPVSFRYSSH
jgi:hypothetical protein